MKREFTKEELLDIQDKYSHWNLEKNSEWVNAEFKKLLTPERKQRIIDYGLFSDNNAELMWVLEKIQGFEKHSSDFVESRIYDYQIYSFDDEFKQRIDYEGIENGYGGGLLTDYVNGRLSDFGPYNNLKEELRYRQLLKECELKNTKFISKRMKDVECATLEDEIQCRTSLKDCEGRNTEFIQQRVFKYTDDFNIEKLIMNHGYTEALKQEVDYRIRLEVLEAQINNDGSDNSNDSEEPSIVLSSIGVSGINTTFIKKRISELNFKGIEEELNTRIKLKGCEKFSTDYVEQRIVHYTHKDIEEEITNRVKLYYCEKLDTDFVKFRVQNIIGKISPEKELEKREILSECEKHNSEWIMHRLNDFQYYQGHNTEEHQNIKEELEYRQIIEQCEIHNSDFIAEGIKFYRGRGLEIKTPHEELQHRLTLKECEKFNTEYISVEIARLKDEYLLRNPEEELKNRMDISFFEKNVKDEEKVGDRDNFWNRLSVHGLENMKILKEALNQVGRGFCLAKWNQVSILLQSGQTHSCHHPRPHLIPLDEIKENPSALHNTQFKKTQRAQMLKGNRPPECDYCWKVEDSNKDSYSDRILKSGEGWAFPHFDRIKKSDPFDDVQPSYVEISFSNQCNMACGYCDVKSSSNWQQEIASKGPYPTSGLYNNTEWIEREGHMPIPHTKPNPYRDAFWEWWPDLFPNLHTFRITGGEPLLSKDTFKVLDYIIENPGVNPKIEISINSNLSGPQRLIDKFIEKVKYITDNNLVWNFSLFTSIESWAEKAEYMRDGMDTKRFWDNVDLFLTECKKPEVTLMSTYNLTSVSSYDKVIKKVFELKKKHYNGERYRHYAIILDTAYIRHPEFLQVRLLSKEWIDKIREDVELMETMSEEKYTHIYGHGHSGYYDFEREKLRRVLDWVEAPLDDVKWLLKMRKDFILFIDEYDKRRGKNFLETFPEMTDFYNSCKKLLV